jgi:hypothetical protein
MNKSRKAFYRPRRSWAGMRSFESWRAGGMSPKQWIIARAVMKRESEWRQRQNA